MRIMNFPRVQTEIYFTEISDTCGTREGNFATHTNTYRHSMEGLNERRSA